MNFNQAYNIARPLAKALEPHCLYNKIAIAGGLRRRKTGVHDIDIVAAPMTVHIYDLFKQIIGEKRIGDFVDTVKSFGKILKGDPGDGKMIQIALPENIVLDLFIADKDNFGWIYCLKTGSSEFNIKMLQWLRREGITSDDGYLWNGSRLSVSEERDVFKLAKIDWITPRKRS